MRAHNSGDFVVSRKNASCGISPGAQAELGPDNAAYFEKCEEKLGFVPNVLRAYSFDNAKLRAFILMSDDLMLGASGLSKTEREMIAVTVSAVNHCHYCLTSHGAALRQRSGNPELSETIAQKTPWTPPNSIATAASAPIGITASAAAYVP